MRCGHGTVVMRLIRKARRRALAVRLLLSALFEFARRCFHALRFEHDGLRRGLECGDALGESGLGVHSWIGELAVKARPAGSLPLRLDIPAPHRLGAGSRRKAHAERRRRQASDAGLDDALRWGIDHEESRAAAAAVPGIH
jgi:hypothetical protein